MSEKQSQKFSNCVTVLGSPRSGTSMIAGLLHILGVDMGNLRPSDRMNTRGYFEDSDFLKISNSIFNDAKPGSDGFSPPTLEEILAVKEKYKENIKAFLYKRHNEAGGRIWGWKSPTTCLFVELLLPHLIEPRFIIVLRHPLGIARSIVEYTSSKHKSYEALTPLRALEIANRYYSAIFAMCNNHSGLGLHIVSYEEIVSNTREELVKIGDFIGVSPTSLQVRNAENYVLGDKRLRLFKAEKKAIQAIKDFLGGPYRMMRRLLGINSKRAAK